VKLGFTTWTATLGLLTGLVLVAGCGGTDNNPFGSSGGSGGGGGGGAPGTTVMQVLSNDTAGSFGALALTVGTVTPGVPDTLIGDANSTFLDLSSSNSLSAMLCPFPGTAPICSQTSQYPTYNNMITWTLKFDLLINMNPANINSIAVSYGPPQCALVYNLPKTCCSPSFTTVTITPAMFNNSGCTTPSVPYVNTVFGITVLRAGTAVAGDGMYIDNVRWVR
jgi:hypothetical protein